MIAIRKQEGESTDGLILLQSINFLICVTWVNKFIKVSPA